MALQENRIKHGITIVGAGTTGYLTTLFLCKNYPNVQIRWVYPKVNKPIGVGEATVPEVTSFLKELGISPEIILKDLKGSLKLGIKFKDFYEKGKSFNHPFGNTDQESYNINYMINNDIVPHNILDYDEIATHFDVRELMKYLDDIFDQFDNLTIERRIVQSTDEFDEDIIIDCTGFSKALADYNFVDITDKIPNNRAMVYRTKYKDISQKVPYTTAQAMQNGWIWNISLKDEMSIGYIYDDTYDVKEEFIKYLEENYNDVDQSKIFEVPMITGRNEEHIIEKIINKSFHLV